MSQVSSYHDDDYYLDRCVFFSLTAPPVPTSSLPQSLTPSNPSRTFSLASIDVQTRALEKKKQKLNESIAESEQVSHALHAKALELAQFREIEGARLAADAKAFIAKYSHAGHKQQQQQQHGGGDGGGAGGSGGGGGDGYVEDAAMAKERRDAVRRSERKLDLKLHGEKLVAGMPPLEHEGGEWARRAAHATEQRRRALVKLRAVPRRYRETVADVRKKLIKVLEERADLAEALSAAELGGVVRIEQLHEELSAASRETTRVADDLAELRRDAAHWEQQVAMIEARCVPFRERVAVLQRRFRDFDPSALGITAGDFFDDNEEEEEDEEEGREEKKDDRGEQKESAAADRRNRGLLVAVLEGLAADGIGDLDGEDSDPTSVPVGKVRQAVLEYLAPEFVDIDGLGLDKVLAAVQDCGLGHRLASSSYAAKAWLEERYSEEWEGERAREERASKAAARLADQRSRWEASVEAAKKAQEEFDAKLLEDNRNRWKKLLMDKHAGDDEQKIEIKSAAQRARWEAVVAQAREQQQQQQEQQEEEEGGGDEERELPPGVATFEEFVKTEEAAAVGVKSFEMFVNAEDAAAAVPAAEGLRLNVKEFRRLLKHLKVPLDGAYAGMDV